MAVAFKFNTFAQCYDDTATGQNYHNNAEEVVFCNGTNTISPCPICLQQMFSPEAQSQVCGNPSGNYTGYTCNKGSFQIVEIDKTGTPVCPDKSCVDYRDQPPHNVDVENDSLDDCTGGA